MGKLKAAFESASKSPFPRAASAKSTSIEMLVVAQFKKTFDYRLYHGNIYIWKNDHWEQVTGGGINTLEHWVLERLQLLSSTRANSSLVSTSIATIKMARLDDTKAIQMEEDQRLSSESLIVPTKGKWLRLVRSKFEGMQLAIEVVEPDKQHFLTYNVNVDMSSKPLGEYVPQPVRYDTKLKAYVASTFKEIDYIKLFQDYLGYTLLKRNFAKKVLCFIGEGNSGKSAALRIMELLHDPSKVHSMCLTNNSGFALSHLLDASLITIGESENEDNQSIISEGIFKQLTGGDRVFVDVKFGTPVSTKISAPIVMATNKKFSITDKSGAMHNRFIYLPVSKPSVIIPEVEKHIARNELRDLLDFALIGLLRVVNRPHGNEFHIPQNLIEFMNEDRIENSAIRNFVEECGLLVVESGPAFSTQELWTHINEWFLTCSHGTRPMKIGTIKSEIALILRENGFEYQEKQEKVGGSSGKKICNVIPLEKAKHSRQVLKTKPLSPTSYSHQKAQGKVLSSTDPINSIVSEYIYQKTLEKGKNLPSLPSGEIF